MTQALKDLLTRVRLGSFDAEADILEMFRSATAAGVAQTALDMRSALQLLTSLDRIAESFRNVDPCRHNNDNLIGDLKIELAGLREALVGPSISSTGGETAA